MSPVPHQRKVALSGLRLFILAAALVATVGAVGQGVGLVMLTTAVGPTAYILLAAPGNESTRLYNALLGHACATVCGLAFLAAFGLWNAPSVPARHHETWPQIGAQALAVGTTLLLLALLDAHHAPAATTALLITSGIARPGPPLYGMLAGLALLIAGAAVLARVPGYWHQQDGDEKR